MTAAYQILPDLGLVDDCTWTYLPCPIGLILPPDHLSGEVQHNSRRLRVRFQVGSAALPVGSLTSDVLSKTALETH